MNDFTEMATGGALNCSKWFTCNGHRCRILTSIARVAGLTSAEISAAADPTGSATQTRIRTASLQVRAEFEFDWNSSLLNNIWSVVALIRGENSSSLVKEGNFSINGRLCTSNYNRRRIKAVGVANETPNGRIHLS